jgi:hypothetical protein
LSRSTTAGLGVMPEWHLSRRIVNPFPIDRAGRYASEHLGAFQSVREAHAEARRILSREAGIPVKSVPVDLWIPERGEPLRESNAAVISYARDDRSWCLRIEEA